MKKDTVMDNDLEIPQGIEARVEHNKVFIKGPKGSLEREFLSKSIVISKDSNLIKFTARPANKRNKTMMNTFMAHIRNMLNGVVNGYSYSLKVCSGHFPITVALKGNELSVKNFLGEKIPRVVKINSDVKVKVEGDKITVEGIDIEKTGQCAASIEQSTRITNRDRRIFQDGIWITSKPGA
ncbi:MAG: 50S ribosomal protein L6 [Candidatus Woesearchaeota archaeon]